MKKRVVDIPGFESVEDIYIVNCRGEVFSDYKNGFLKAYKKENGYLQYSLKTKNDNYKKVYAHRLAALSFLDNPKELKEVNHKDENKENNSIDNLEWCDRLYNQNYGSAIARMKETKNKNPINVYDLEGEILAEGLSISEATKKFLGFKQTRAKDKYVNGVFFAKDNKNETLNEIIAKSRKKPVILIDIKTGEKQIFKTMSEVAEKFGRKINITDALRKGHIIKKRYKVSYYTFKKR